MTGSAVYLHIYSKLCEVSAINLVRVNTFKYLGATLTENGNLDVDMTHRIQSGWKNWKRPRGYQRFCATEE